MLQWISSNWPAVLSVISMLLAVGVTIAHLFHADSVANSLQNIENIVSQLQSGGNSNVQKTS
jgi:hypothetical protein